MKKITKKENFERLADIVRVSEVEDKEAMLEFIAHEVELLSNRSSASKPSKDQKANIEIRKAIHEYLSNLDKAVTVTELMAVMPNEVETSVGAVVVTNQKVSALLKQMKDAGEVVRTVEKKKAYFALAE